MLHAPEYCQESHQTMRLHRVETVTQALNLQMSPEEYTHMALQVLWGLQMFIVPTSLMLVVTLYEELVSGPFCHT